MRNSGRLSTSPYSTRIGRDPYKVRRFGNGDRENSALELPVGLRAAEINTFVSMIRRRESITGSASATGKPL